VLPALEKNDWIIDEVPVKCLTLPAPRGWIIDEGTYVPVKCLTLPAPRSVIELIKCACKVGCMGVAPVARTALLALLCVNSIVVIAQMSHERQSTRMRMMTNRIML